MILFFDLDGTICDTLEDLGNAVNVTLDQFGYPKHEISAYRKMVGNGLKRLLQRALPQENWTGEEMNIMLVKMYPVLLKYYKEHVLDFTRPYPGIPEMLCELGKIPGCRLYVNTNKPQEQAERIVEELFPGQFVEVYGQRDGVPLKPDPSAVWRILREESTCPDACWYIGDSDVDIYTGKNAGIKTIGCSWGFQGAERLEQCGADYVVCSPLDILSIIGF